MLRRCRAVKCKATWQRNEIRVSILQGIKVTVRFFLLPLTHSNRVGVWNAECWQVNQHQHVFAGKSLCAKRFKSCVGSGDSSNRDQPEPSSTLVERVLACFACLCYHLLPWLRLLTLALSIGHCQCSYIFFSCWLSACNLQVTWIKNIVRSNGSLEYVRSLFTRAHPLEPELPSAIKYFFNSIHIRLNVFLKQWVYIEHWIWIPIQWTVPNPE